MGTFIVFRAEEIKASLEGISRQYMVGNLKNKQVLEFIFDEHLEIGITSYDKFQSESAHRHSIAVEYQYIISGWTQYLDVETGVIHEFKKGDFFAIMPNTTYAQRSKPGTEILFIKVPSINDKELVDVTEETTQWLATKLKTVRKDYFYDPNAPKPNSIKPAAAVALINEKGAILMIKRADSGLWTMPGGTLDFGESLHECAVREIREECGCSVTLTDIIGTYTDPQVLIAYSDGEVRQEFTIVYAGQVSSETIILDEESTDYRWVPIDQLISLPLAGSQKNRLKDVIDYYTLGKKPSYTVHSSK